jgi:ubiquinone/menaquinone biosynthesis C-methylase UbiE
MEKAEYWDDIYKKKDEMHQSWFQEKPEKSLEMIDELALPKSSKIVDIGGGESRLVDFLLERGFKNISILDISQESLDTAKHRLGVKSEGIKFLNSDVTIFNPAEKYDLWHDRATFHFLTQIEDIEKYLKIAHEALNVGGSLIVSTFSTTGPDKCSGLTISKYSQDDLKRVFGKYFQNTKCFENTHTTPWGANQDFVYCSFKKI